jgi:hypothetical protein
MPIGVNYQRLQAPSNPSMTAVLDVKLFSGQFYVIAEYDDGNVYHFFNGSRVTGWDVVAAASADFTTLAALLAQKIGGDANVTAEPYNASIRIAARVPGVPFTITASTANASGGTNDQAIALVAAQANAVAVSEVVATGTITVTGGTEKSGHNKATSVQINGTEVLNGTVEWAGSNGATAVRIAQQINNNTTATGYSAATTDNVVTISALAGTGATPNGYAVDVTTVGDINVSSTDMAGGVTAVAAQAQIETATFSGTFDAKDTFTLTINGVDYKATNLASGTARSCNVFFNRVWSPANSLWRYSMLNRPDIIDPADATDGNDAGFLNVATAANGNESLVAAERYQSFTAVFSADEIVMWALDTDPANFAIQVPLDNTGTNAKHSIVRYGNNDVFYLDPTGVRSLRALNASNAPFVSDVGNAIDTFITDYLATLTEKQKRAAFGAIEPIDGRFMLAVGAHIFVLSYFPGAKISAWSYYTPGFEVETMCRAYNKLYLRSGDTIYLYGGDDGKTWPDNDELPCTVEWPFLSAQTPATLKGLTGVDLAVTNDWSLKICVDPNNPDRSVDAGVINSITVNGPSINVPGQTSVMAAKLVCKRAGRATISMGQIHYDIEEAR